MDAEDHDDGGHRQQADPLGVERAGRDRAAASPVARIAATGPPTAAKQREPKPTSPRSASVCTRVAVRVADGSVSRAVAGAGDDEGARSGADERVESR